MTDPTPTPQTPPQGLTDEQLLELAEKELCIDDMKDAHEEHYPIEVVTDGLIAAMRAAIAAHEAARPQPTPPPRSPMELTDKQLLELADGEIEADDVLPMDEYEAANDRALEVYRPELIAVMHAAIAADRAARPQLTPKEVEARFRAWWGECYPNVPAGRHTVRSHVAFALHLLGGEVQ